LENVGGPGSRVIEPVTEIPIRETSPKGPPVFWRKGRVRTTFGLINGKNVVDAPPNPARAMGCRARAASTVSIPPHYAQVKLFFGEDQCLLRDQHIDESRLVSSQAVAFHAPIEPIAFAAGQGGAFAYVARRLVN